MRFLLALCMVALVLAGPAARGEEPYHSRNMSWLREAKPVMKFFIDLFEPLERANGAATAYLTGEIDKEEALYRLERARSSMTMISDNIEWSIGLMQPVPEGGSAESRALIDTVSNLSPRLHDLDASIEQAISLLETFVENDDYRAYKGGTHQTLSAIEAISTFIDPYHDIDGVTIPDWDNTSQNIVALAKLDDKLSFQMIELFYTAATTSDAAIPQEALEHFVTDLGLYSAAIDRLDKDLVQMRKDLATSPNALMERGIEQQERENAARHKRVSAYHKLLASLSTEVPSPDLIDAAFAELTESYNMVLPPYKRVWDRASELDAEKNPPPSDNDENVGILFDTPL